MNRGKSRWCLLTGILALALAGASEPVTPLQSEASRDADPISQASLDLQRIDGLLHEGRYPAAEDASRQGLARLEAAGQGATVSAALYADRLVETLLISGKGTRQETLETARMAVAVKEDQLGGDNIETARSLVLLGRTLTRKASFDEAEQTLARSLEIAEQAEGPESLAAGLTRQAIAGLLYARGQYQPATALFEAVLVAQERILGPDDPAVAVTLRMLGDCAKWQNDQPAALRLLEQSRTITANALGPSHPDVAKTLNSLGQTLRQAGEFDRAKVVLEEAVTIFEQTLGPDSPLVASALASLGAVLSDTGDFSTAVRVLERALDLRTREYGQVDKEVISTRNDIGIVQLQMGNYPAAARRFGECLETTEKLNGPWHISVAAYVDNLAIALASNGQLEEAEPLFTRSLEIRIRTFGKDNQAVAHSLVNLAEMNGSLHEYEKQKDYARRALDTLEKLGDTNRWLIGSALSSLTNAARGLGETEYAVQYSTKTTATMEGAFGRFHPEYARALAVHARVLVENGQLQDGWKAAMESETLSREHLALTIQTATERDALAYAASRASTLDLLVSLALSDFPVMSAWDSVTRSRGLVLDEMMTRRRISLQVSDPALLGLWNDVDAANRQLAKLVVTGPKQGEPDDFDASVSAARTGKERAQRAFADASIEYRRNITLGRSGLDDVIDALPPDTALVAFVEYVHDDFEKTSQVKPVETGIPSYAAFVVQARDRTPRVMRLGSKEQIEHDVTRWRNSITHPAMAGGRDGAAEALYREAAASLRQAVWDPIAMQLGNVRQVLIVSEGALHTVDFAALPTGDVTYLAETGPKFHYLSTERDVLPVDPVLPGYGLLAVGGPDFDAIGAFASLHTGTRSVVMAEPQGNTPTYRGQHSACGRFQSMSFESLQASLQEVVSITESWKQGAGDSDSAIILTGEAASEAAFRQMAVGRQVLHLATHGFFLGGDCGSLLNPLEGAEVMNENPLLLSGLALAGANQRAAAGPSEDDGILTAEEIATLDLGGTEWAVMSACDTGSGEILFGEGVFGLQRAFRIAGARTMIMSLWPVEDSVARDWMSALYRRHFIDRRSTLDAVHDANLELLTSRRARGLNTHPFYWSGFIAAGDWQ